jgi:proline dehydrogenase
MFHHHQDHDREAEEFVYRLMSDPMCFERFVYTDTIDNYKNIIEQLQKQYDDATLDIFKRAKIQSGIAQAKRELAKTQAQYRIYKRYKMKTTISK